MIAGAGLAPVAQAQDGKALYETHCLSCHQADGNGVPFMQPPLVDSAVVTGDALGAAQWVLLGTPPGDGVSGGWANAMPGFSRLSDEEIAAILTWVRTALPHAEPVEEAEVSTETVAEARALLKDSGVLE